MSFLEPASIAVIGASDTPGKVGYALVHNLIKQGYKGTVYPVNPKGGEIQGMKAFTSVADIPGDVECAVIATPAPTVAAVAEECGTKGVTMLVIITAGFGETGTEDGKKMERDIKEICTKHGMKLIGTNCLGAIRPGIGMNASFAKDIPSDGPVALISQSGAMAVALLDASAHLHMGYSLVLSIGNKTLMDECDFLEFCENDKKTNVIGLYVESIADGRRFLEIARRVTPLKPVVMIKAGTSQKGKHAVSSHTGALAGSDAAIDAVCAQTGIHRAKNTEEFLDLLQTLSMQPALLTSRIAIITNAGGPGILATDAAEKEKLQLPSLETDTQEALRKALPPAASVANPIDVLGDAHVDRYAAALDACGQDPNIDGIAALLTPQVMTPVMDIAKAIVAVAKKYPLMPIATSFMGEESVKEARSLLRENGIPSFETPERAIRALSALRTTTNGTRPARRGENLRRGGAELLKNHSGLLPEAKTEELFAVYDLPLPKQAVATTADDAVTIARAIGFPVIAKISSPDILHKTDVGGIRANLKTNEEVKNAFLEISANVKKNAPDASVNGILIQKFLPAGNEFIVGALRDPSFGPLVMVGLGGIYTELFRDTAFRVEPVCEEEAYVMLQELRAWNLLLGARGKPQADIAALAKTIACVSALMHDCPQIVELDLNPVLVSEEGIVIADAKVVIA